MKIEGWIGVLIYLIFAVIVMIICVLFAACPVKPKWEGKHSYSSARDICVDYPPAIPVADKATELLIELTGITTDNFFDRSICVVEKPFPCCDLFGCAGKVGGIPLRGERVMGCTNGTNIMVSRTRRPCCTVDWPDEPRCVYEKCFTPLSNKDLNKLITHEVCRGWLEREMRTHDPNYKDKRMWGKGGICSKVKSAIAKEFAVK